MLIAVKKIGTLLTFSRNDRIKIVQDFKWRVNWSFVVRPSRYSGWSYYPFLDFHAPPIRLRPYLPLLGKSNMETGTVKWFNDAKGFGFITPDGGGEDLFAHFSEIRIEGFKTLQENQKVTFEVKTGPKGK